MNSGTAWSAGNSTLPATSRSYRELQIPNIGTRSYGHLPYYNPPSTLPSHGSPSSQGPSPLTPLTPLHIDMSFPPNYGASMPLYPSPGSAGSSSEHFSYTPSGSPMTYSDWSFIPQASNANSPNYNSAALYSPAENRPNPAPLPQAPLRLEPDFLTPHSMPASISSPLMSETYQRAPANRPYFATFQSAPVTVHAASRSVENLSEPPANLQPYNFSGFTLPGPVVPQTPYKPKSASDKRRYVDGVEFHDPIWFFSVHPDELGFSLEEARQSRFTRLQNREDRVFRDIGPSISVRVSVSGRHSVQYLYD
jgi:hypothetical protein